MKKCGCNEKFSCGCCEGIEILTPQATANRPGLSALRYRVGTHSTFFETMLARLSNSYLETAEIDAADNPTGRKTYPLKNLNTRAADDPSIALLDASAMMLDVLTFYQERIVNEGYLKTATERRSILELARLVGYTLRPGVAASVFLAYTLDDNSEPVEIPVGARAQSVPAPVKSSADAAAQSAPPPVELPQSFETSEKIEARKEWNNLQPRLSKPPKIKLDNVLELEFIYLDGTDTRLKPNDPILFVFEDRQTEVQIEALRRVQIVKPDFENLRTQIILQSLPAAALAARALIVKLRDLLEGIDTGPPGKILDLNVKALLREAATIEQNILLGVYPLNAAAKDVAAFRESLGGLIHGNGNSLPQLQPVLDELDLLFNLHPTPPKVSVQQTNLDNLFNSLLVKPSRQPANRFQLQRKPQEIFKPDSNIRTQLLVSSQPLLAKTLYPALAKATVSVAEPELKAVYALRVTAPLFGYNALPITFVLKGGKIEPRVPPEEPTLQDDELSNQLFLDKAYEEIQSSNKNKPSYVVINYRRDDESSVKAFQIIEAKIAPRTAYLVSSNTTALILDGDWWMPPVPNETTKSPEDFTTIRRTNVYTQSEELTLIDNPIEDDIGGDTIELSELYDGLESGRWIIVSGERADITGVEGVVVSELAMLTGVEQGFKPGDKYHTTLRLAGQNADGRPGLQYKYRRKTVKIYGNVVKATHGETRGEVLGSGDAAQAMQAFMLKQPPLTYVSAPTTSGIESTLKVRVNDIEWHKTDTLSQLKPQDRNFVTKTDDEAKTTVIFGNGEQGARLPTDIENVKAVYRSGIGKPGNVKAGQISLLMTKPLGVREVINPLRASGGADKETGDQARRNVPIALMALDRLVSTRDYADFARTFAGIGKASATRLSDGRRQIVHLTIAGADDIPIDVNSDLFNNLRGALAKYGDSFVPVQVVQRELLALVIVANVHIRPDYLWESVEPKIRTALGDTFSFERRELGQSVFLSEVIKVIQAVKGVSYVDVDMLDGITETELADTQLLNDKFGKLRSLSGGTKQYIRADLARVETVSETNEKKILPAQLAYLSPDVRDTLILNKIGEVKK